MITIVDYRPEHQPYFEKFNRQWIEEHWELEPLDIAVLQKPEENILHNGGAILMALYDGEVALIVGIEDRGRSIGRREPWTADRL